MIKPGYTDQDVTKVPGWHGLVAWDLLFNNLTTGLFLFAAVGELASPVLLGPVARAAYPVALVFLLTDLMMLVLDLGDPLRFHHMLRVFKPSSPMSLGTWSLTVYSLPLTLIVAIEAAQALGLLPSGSTALEWVRKSAVVFGLLPAFGSARLQGGALQHELATGLEGRPMAGRLHGQFRTDAGLRGAARRVGPDRTCTGRRRSPHRRRGAALAQRHPDGSTVHRNFARPSPESTVTSRFTWPLVFTFVGGTLVPLILLLAGGGAPSSLGAVSLILLGGLAVRVLFIKIPHASHESRSAGKA